MAQRQRVWIERWDRVELEQRVPCAETVRIPDIVLWRGDVVVGAIEVFHSHAVSLEKAKALSTAAVPWIEVLADTALLGGPDAGSGWTLEDPLPVHRQSDGLQWRCHHHETRYRAWLDAERRRREAARHTERLVAVKLADLFYPSGKLFRNIYQVVERSTDAIAHSLALTREKQTLLNIPVSVGKVEARRRIDERVEADLHAVEAVRDVLTDSPMEWARGPLAVRMMREVERIAWSWVPLERTHPVRLRFERKSGEWFMPPDFREVD